MARKKTTKKTKPSITSLLSRQSVQKRKSKKQPTLKRKIGVTSLGVVGLCSVAFVSWYLFFQTTPLKQVVQQKTPIDWQVSVRSYPINKLTPQQVQAINRQIKRKLTSFNAQLVSQQAASLQKILNADRVNIIRNGPQKLFIQVNLRHPVMVTKVRHWMYVSKSGAIYGKAQPPLELIHLTGLFERTRKSQIKLSKNHQLQLDESQQELVQEAIELRRLALNRHIDVKKIHYINFRGFSLRTNKGGTEVHLGRAPFKENLDRLTKILKDMKKKGRLASRIELDYNGKAFIKENENINKKL